MNHLDIGIYYDNPLLEKINFQWLSVEMGLNVKIIDTKASVTQDTLIPGFEVTESEKDTAIIPMQYLGVSFRPTNRLACEGDFRGLSYSDNDMYSIVGRLKYNTYGPLFIAGGYRYDVGHFDLFGLNFDVDFSGDCVETGIYF